MTEDPVKKDKALHELFRRSQSDNMLSAEFTRTVMRKAGRIEKSREMRDLILVAATSLALGTAVYFLLTEYLGINIWKSLQKAFTPHPESKVIYVPYLFVALIAWVLLWLDYRLRKRFGKH